MRNFNAYEFINTIEGPTLTGRVESYPAPDLDSAVRHCLYAHSLRTGRAHVGPTGHTVHAGLYSYSMTQETRRSSNVSHTKM